ncbi:MAG: DNA polymerase III subunit gamma/tau [Chromatiales bacterium]|nr:DNA polymerase III subunit gamma/tau [Chromatiales bacterium]
MSYQVLARKWRPRTFEEVIGQQHIIQTLQNALSLGRLHHAYLFSGTRGVGKTTLARILAKCFNCEKGVSAIPCNKCNACQQTDSGHYVDFIEVDAASRTGVENMRELLDNVPYAPNTGSYKIYLIDEVHMLSISSFNALLKTLEEPPGHIKFFFATTHPQKIPVTILSRCLQFNLLRLPHTLIRDYISKMLDQEHVDFEKEALDEIAVAADGSVRDALSLLDQAISYGGGTLKSDAVKEMLGSTCRSQVVELLNHIAVQDISGAIALSDEIYQSGADFNDVLRELIALLHLVALRQALPTNELLPQFDETDIDKLATNIAPQDIQLYYQFALANKRDMAIASDYKGLFDMTLLKMICFVPMSQPASHQAQTYLSNTMLRTTEAICSADKTTDIANQIPDAENNKQSTAVAKNSGHSLTDCNSVEAWQQYIEASGLAGAARGICLNSLLAIQADNRVTIEIAPDIKDLCTKEMEEEILNTLVKLDDKDIQLAFKYTEPEVTPVAEYDRINREKQCSAEQSIKEDPHVQALQKKLGAQIIMNTTKPREAKN